jgi:hypothetical protein
VALTTLDVPMWGVLPRGWSFLSGLPDGGMAVLAQETEQVVLLNPDLEPRTAVTIPGLRSAWSLAVSICAEAGLVAVSFADGLRVFEVASGNLVHQLPHRTWPVLISPTWTSSGRLLWTVVPTDTPGVDEVVAIDPGGWTTLGRLTIPAPSTNQGSYRLLPSPVSDQVGVLGALADSDGFYLVWPKWDGNAVVSPAETLSGHQLTDVAPDGRGFVTVTDDWPSELAVFDLTTGQPTGRLDMDTATGTDEAEDVWDDVVYGPSSDHLIAATGETRVLLLRRTPLRVVAQLRLEGYQHPVFDGTLVDTVDDALPLLGQVQRWADQRLVASHYDHRAEVWNSRIYDLSTIELPG